MYAKTKIENKNTVKECKENNHEVVKDNECKCIYCRTCKKYLVKCKYAKNYR